LEQESTEGKTTYYYNEKNQLYLQEDQNGQTYYQYDRDGNITKQSSPQGSRKYFYNSERRQVRVELEDGNVQWNRYDPEGLWDLMRTQESSTKFIYHQGELLYERTGEEEISYHLGNGIDGLEKNQQLFYYHRDEQRSTAYLSDPQGRIQNEYQYGAFGELKNYEEKIPNRIRYTGQQYDGLTGQYYVRARYYHPALGRFLQEDVNQNDGLNLYAYCANNPVIYYDPSGYSYQKDMAGTVAGMSYEEKKQALYDRRDEYIQGKIDDGTLKFSDKPLLDGELDVNTYKGMDNERGAVLTPHHMPSNHSIRTIEDILESDGACINVYKETHKNTFTYGMGSVRAYDTALYEAMSYEERLRFDLSDLEDIYKRTRSNVDLEEVRIKLEEQYKFAMDVNEKETLKPTNC
jgi:RHS repeat-associated protein